MSRPHQLVLFLVLGSALPAPAQAPVRFRFWKSIERAAAKDEEIVAFSLDSDIYSVARPGYPDLRVADDKQAEAPYQIEKFVEYREERTHQPFDAEVVSLRQEGNGIEMRLRLPEKSPTAEGFSIITPLTNYEHKVRVSGSADGTDWKPLVTDGIIFDYTRFVDVSNHEIALPPNDYRLFKIAIDDVTDEKESPFKELARTLAGGKEEKRVERTVLERRPFRIDRIAPWHVITRERVQKVKSAEYPIVGLDVKEDTSKKQSIVTVRTRREPLTQLTLETPSRNFSRRAVVEVPVVRGVKTDWHPVCEATVSSFHFRNLHREKLTIAFGEQREPEFRIVIHNEDNPPLEVRSVKAEGNVERVLFLAEPSRAYRVYYGSETAEAPKYEAATVLAALRQDALPVVATLGAQVENTELSAEPGLTLRQLLNNWIFLGTAIAVMVVVLGWALFRAGRRLEGLPKD